MGTSIGPVGKSKKTLDSLRFRPNETIIGIRDAILIHTADDGTHPLTQTITFINSGDWIDLDSEAARILLTNSSGSSVDLQSVSVRGKPVTMLAGAEGYIHDAFYDTEDIDKYGEQVFEFGSVDITNIDQLNQLADYRWKDLKDAKHIYVIRMDGMRQYINPQAYAWLDIGSAGEAENIKSLCEVFNVRMMRRAGELGETVVILREVQEAWKFNSNASARFMASGGKARTYNNKVTINIASQYYPLTADDYCDGTNDEVVINRWIATLAANGINGTIHLTAGTYNLRAAIDGASNIILEGEGAATIVKKNANDYTVRVEGGSGTEISGFEMRDMTVTRDSGDANVIPLVYLNYADNCQFVNVTVEDSLSDGIIITNCDVLRFVGCTITDIEARGIEVDVATTDLTIQECNIYSDDDGIYLDNVTGCTITDCNIETVDAIGYGIITRTGNVSGLIISNCAVRNCGGVGIFIDSNYATISGCDVDGCSNGIVIDNSEHVTVSGCTTINNTFVGIGTDDSDHCTITANVAEGNTDGMLLLRSNENSISANETINNSGYGIAIADVTSDGNVVQGNVSTGNTTAQFLDNGVNTVEL